MKKEKQKYKGNLIKILFLLFFIWFSVTGILLEQWYNAGYGDEHSIICYWLGLKYLMVVSIILMVVPLVLVLINKDKLSTKNGKNICMWNSIIFLVISMILYSSNNLFFITFIDAIIYYFINKWLFVYDEDIECQKETYKRNTHSIKKNDKHYNHSSVSFKSSKVDDDDEYDDEEESDDTRRKIPTDDIDKKYSSLKKLKRLLDENIITQEEFDKEKKKILK